MTSVLVFFDIVADNAINLTLVRNKPEFSKFTKLFSEFITPEKIQTAKMSNKFTHYF